MDTLTIWRYIGDSVKSRDGHSQSESLYMEYPLSFVYMKSQYHLGIYAIVTSFDRFFFLYFLVLGYFKNTFMKRKRFYANIYAVLCQAREIDTFAAAVVLFKCFPPLTIIKSYPFKILILHNLLRAFFRMRR